MEAIEAGDEVEIGFINVLCRGRFEADTVGHPVFFSMLARFKD